MAEWSYCLRRSNAVSQQTFEPSFHHLLNPRYLGEHLGLLRLVDFHWKLRYSRSLHFVEILVWMSIFSFQRIQFCQIDARLGRAAASVEQNHDLRHKSVLKLHLWTFWLFASEKRNHQPVFEIRLVDDSLSLLCCISHSWFGFVCCPCCFHLALSLDTVVCFCEIMDLLGFWLWYWFYWVCFSWSPPDYVLLVVLSTSLIFLLFVVLG